jgi:hypothetical protein
MTGLMEKSAGLIEEQKLPPVTKRYDRYESWSSRKNMATAVQAGTFVNPELNKYPTNK